MARPSAWALAALAALALAAARGARAACECGYRDPATDDLWTDAVITYFNETAAPAQIVFRPEQYADRYGRDAPGDAGPAAGQQAWINSDRINEWEDDFSATWRSAVRANNTYLGANGSGLIMDVTPADTKNRISWGAQLQTRRRDMLYGSFRTMLTPPLGRYMAGTDLDIEVAWNQSELIRTAFFNTNSPGQGNVQLSYSSSAQSVTPFLFNQSTIMAGGGSIHDVEYRMDWLPQSVSFTNTGTNTTSNAKAWSGKDVHPPSVGAPFSFKHWSNGSPTGSFGPPLKSTLQAQIIYARLFFNSSRPERQDSFQSSCAAVARSSAQTQTECSTEDLSLRDSTPFDLAATVKQTLPKPTRHVPVYSIYGVTIAGGIFVILTVHAIIRRTLNTRRKRVLFYEKYNQEHAAAGQSSPGLPEGGGSTYAPTSSIPAHPSLLSAPSSASLYADADQLDQKAFHDAMHKWQDPTQLFTEDDDDDDDDDDTSDHSADDNNDDAATMMGAWTPGAPTLDAASSVYSRSTHTTGYVLPYIQTTRGDLSRSGLLTPSQNLPSGTSSPQGGYANGPAAGGAGHQTPLSIFRAHAMPGSHNTYTPIAATSVASFGADDGLGQPPSLPHIAPTVLLEDGSQNPVAWVTPIADWAPAKGDRRSMAHGMLAHPPDAEVVEQNPSQKPQQANASHPEPTSRWGKWKQSLFVPQGKGRATSSGAARVEYLDGLRGFACFLVSLHHFCLIYYYGFTTQPTGSGEHYRFEYWIYKILGPLLFNGGLNVGIFFVLSARVVCNRYLYRGNLQHLAQLIHSRVPRLGVTITAAILINYFLIEVQAFYWTSKLASRTYSIWSYYEDFENVGVFINEWLGLWWMAPPAVTPFITHYATGILWTVPVIVQCTWTCVMCALIAREIKHPAKRYIFYSCCIVLSWWSNRFDYFFLAGLMLADLDVRFQYREKLGELGGSCLALAMFFLGAVLAWLHYANVINKEKEWAIHPDFATGTPNAWAGSTQEWYLPQLADGIWVISFFLLCDLCTPVRFFFQLRFWNVFGRNAFSLYLLHGTVFWSIGAAATLKMLAVGIPYWAAMILNFLLCYTCLLVVCELFTRTFDRWGITLSRSFWRYISGGLGRRPT